jgi:hypothetical protein
VSRIGQAMLRPLFFSPADDESEALNAGAPATDREVHGQRVSRIASTVARLAGLPDPTAHAEKVMAAFLPDVVATSQALPRCSNPVAATGGPWRMTASTSPFNSWPGPGWATTPPAARHPRVSYLSPPQPADLPALADLFGLRGQRPEQALSAGGHVA